MQFPCLIRGFQARPWKSKAGVTNYSGTYTVLDTSERPIMDTIKLDREFESEEAMKRAATLVGKSAVCIVTNLRVSVDGSAHLVGEFEAATK